MVVAIYHPLFTFTVGLKLVMGERLVRIGHAMGIFLLLD
jgi:hypothetical protein